MKNMYLAVNYFYADQRFLLRLSGIVSATPLASANSLVEVWPHADGWIFYSY